MILYHILFMFLHSPVSSNNCTLTYSNSQEQVIGGEQRGLETRHDDPFATAHESFAFYRTG
jgi:hypothetical protein